MGCPLKDINVHDLRNFW